MKGISIIICCYNSALRLPETLRHISEQEVPQHISWEVIVVNNASTDSTVNVAYSEWARLSFKPEIKVIDQPVPGLSAAREKGFEVAIFDYIIFCDDDNWLAKNYLAIAWETMERHPMAGIVGGQTEGVFEIEKPFWFDSFSQSYVVEKPLQKSGYLPPEREYLAGAGMVLRKDLIIALKSIGFKAILTGRIGKSLMSGEDYELCLVANYLGYKIFFEENLKLVHFMTKDRLTWDYCLKMTTYGHAIPEIFYDLYRAAYLASFGSENEKFSRLYYKLLKLYFRHLIFSQHNGLRGLSSFLFNIQLFYIKVPGSILQRKILSSKNKLIFALTNRKLLNVHFVSIQLLIERIKVFKGTTDSLSKK